MKKVTIIFILSLAVLLAKGQGETKVMISYMPSLSMGNTAEFTRNFSPRGIELEVNRFLSEEISLGVSVGWNVFREKVVGESYEYNGMLMTGTQFRYTNIVPLDVNAKKYFIMNDLSPYVGLGIGTSYAEQRNQIGIFSITNDKWLFNVTPEVGMLFYASPELLLSAKIKYSYSLKAGDFPSMSYLGFGLGIGIY